ncbi:phage holin family protein [Olivibacter sp. SDN3]|uniref:phage holin family protein n=1 Tax=Olivibacter sp. SDN3 TaxID=2764720 RepID=UPI001651A2DE|nr:phage holin family protein [Olivibacter sp. SDN3]QNL50704.1 phage holin family protein [Olivibacter sp. SDN3]
MEDKKFSIKGVIQKLKEYVENYTNLAYLKVVAKVSKILPGVVIGIISLLFLFFVVFFLSIAFALFIGELLNSYALGFALTGALFILLILLIILFKNSIKRGVSAICIRTLVSLRNDEDD